MVLANTNYDSKIIVFKKKLDDYEAKQIIEQKKSNVFKGLFKKPKKDEVHTHSTKLFYESILMISGIYTANFFRKAIHPINVDYNVTEVMLGDGIFPIRSKSSLQKALSGKKGKNKIDLELEEHVFINNEDTMYFDHHGKEVQFPFKLDSKNLENYPTRILKEHESNVKKPEITKEHAIELLTKKLKKPLEPEVRDLVDEFTIKEISEIYIPIYEARLIGPKKKVGILRLDAVRNKIL